MRFKEEIKVFSESFKTIYIKGSEKFDFITQKLIFKKGGYRFGRFVCPSLRGLNSNLSVFSCFHPDTYGKLLCAVSKF